MCLRTNLASSSVRGLWVLGDPCWEEFDDELDEFVMVVQSIGLLKGEGSGREVNVLN